MDKANEKPLVIGILGGMGTYATIHAFKQYADIFTAEKEWERPRLLIDNRCTMPSRVRAFIYNENTEQLVDEMVESIRNLIEAGCTRIVLACNTSHLFLPYIYQVLPQARSKITSIIDACVENIQSKKLNDVFLVASEGTIESGIYQQKLAEIGVRVIAPERMEYSLLRECIEAVKQNVYSASVEHKFVQLINRYPACILGCTELPVLYEKYHEKIQCQNAFDPVELAFNKIKGEYAYE